MKIALFLDNIYVYYRKIEGLKDKINKGAYPESPIARRPSNVSYRWRFPPEPL